MEYIEQIDHGAPIEGTLHTCKNEFCECHSTTQALKNELQKTISDEKTIRRAAIEGVDSKEI
jgi:hypothetical protein